MRIEVGFWRWSWKGSNRRQDLRMIEEEFHFFRRELEGFEDREVASD